MSESPRAAGGGLAVVLQSGGIDAMALAYWVAREVHPGRACGFFFDLGLRSSARQRAVVRRTCEALGWGFVEADLAWWRTLLASTLPEAERTPERLAALFRERQGSTVGMVASGVLISATFAELSGGSDLFHALNQEDVARYPHAREVFGAIAGILSLRDPRQPFRVHTPWLERTSDEVLEEAIRLGAPVGETWSCPLDEHLHCGACSACAARKERFRRLGQRHPQLRDPTSYAR
jgi:7-cyano-7-deazaguanine synthase